MRQPESIVDSLRAVGRIVDDEQSLHGYFPRPSCPRHLGKGPAKLGEEDQLLIEPTTGLGLDIDQRLARRNLVMI